MEVNIENVAIIGCGAYMDSGYGCAGEGRFENPSQVIAFVKCECPGRSLAANTGLAFKMSEMKPDVIYLSSCLANAKPGCPYSDPQEIAQILENKTGVRVVSGTHDYI